MQPFGFILLVSCPFRCLKTIFGEATNIIHPLLGRDHLFMSLVCLTRVRPRFFDQVRHEKPCMHLVEISIFSLNLVIIRLTKIMNRADKNWAQFQEIKFLKNQNFQKYFSIKVGLLVKYSL